MAENGLEQGQLLSRSETEAQDLIALEDGGGTARGHPGAEKRSAHDQDGRDGSLDRAPSRREQAAGSTDRVAEEWSQE
jgi:hypothetical protein